MNGLRTALGAAAIAVYSLLPSCMAKVDQSDAITKTFVNVVPEDSNLPANIIQEINENAARHPKDITKAVIEEITKMKKEWKPIDKNTVFSLYIKKSENSVLPVTM